MTVPPPERLFYEPLPTPVGEAVMITDEKGSLRGFDWIDKEDRLRLILQRQYRGLRPAQGAAPRETRQALADYFEGDIPRLKDIPWATAGTAFQRSVWKALTGIPAGTTLSYGRLAEHIGKPRAIRAVGLANGSNPVGVVVPCHRVIGADGSLTGYGGGIERKRWLLAHEGATHR